MAPSDLTDGVHDGGFRPADQTKDLSAEKEILEHYAARHPGKPLNALQKHVLFWDHDCDNVIWPLDVYRYSDPDWRLDYVIDSKLILIADLPVDRGFRSLGFSVLFSLGSLLIPLFFSWPTGITYSWLPDPLFRIRFDTINKAKHGSDSGIYTFDGAFNEHRFDEMFDHFDKSGTGSLSADEMYHLWTRNRCAADPMGWSFAFMEWWTTWLLMQKDGRVWKDDLRACYDGTLFWRISNAQKSGEGWNQGYGVGDFLKGVIRYGTWRVWEARGK